MGIKTSPPVGQLLARCTGLIPALPGKNQQRFDPGREHLGGKRRADGRRSPWNPGVVGLDVVVFQQRIDTACRWLIRIRQRVANVARLLVLGGFRDRWLDLDQALLVASQEQRQDHER